jgi:hypothetical protein
LEASDNMKGFSIEKIASPPQMLFSLEVFSSDVQ